MHKKCSRYLLFNHYRIGANELIHKPIACMMSFAILICFILIAYNLYIHETLTSISLITAYAVLVITAILILSLLVLQSSSFFYDIFFIVDAMRRIGMTNHYDETPLLVKRIKNEKLLEYRFYSNGISVDQWNRKKEDIENVLNMSIASIKLGDDVQNIIVCGREGVFDLSCDMVWQRYRDLLPGNILVLGVDAFGVVKLDLDLYPHVLIAGASGSGKTFLLRLILMQCILKKYDVILADLKGGLDFSDVWFEKIDIITEPEDCLSKLKELYTEFKLRRDLLKQCHRKSIDDYNDFEVPTKPLKRIIFACDEVGELLDSAGASKTEKEIMAQIDSILRHLARAGRALGIHLILGTQRPDATILSGQIKNQLNYRVCGRADINLSEIVLDNGMASRISKESQGVFVNHEGDIFKTFLFDETEIE